MRSIIASILFLSLTSIAAADGPSTFFKETLPEHAMAKMLESWGAVQGEGSVLDAKTRELIALAVAAQIPCECCVHAHSTTLMSKLGASASELKEAIAVAGYIRLWSTVLNGNAYDIDAFKAEYNQLMSAN